MPSPRATTRDIALNDQRYQLKKLPAETGSWVAMEIATKMVPGLAGAMLSKFIGVTLPSGRPEMNEAEFFALQKHALSAVGRYDQQPGNSGSVAMPIRADSGLWAFEDLKYDTPTVLALTVHSILFNVADFFDEGVLSGLLKSFEDLTLPSPSK